MSPLSHQPQRTKILSQIMSPRISAQKKSRQSMTSTHNRKRAANARRFPFFKLPAELRNNIYSLVVITGQEFIIQDMHLDDLKRLQDKGTYQRRSTYLPTDHVCDKECWPESPDVQDRQPCIFKCPWSRPLKTTYMAAAPVWNDDMTTVMLLNKQSRDEVAFIFYGSNTFHFRTMSSLTPFMKDRTPESRKYIHRLYLLLTIHDRDWDAIFAEHGRPATWNTAFSNLSELSHVNIRSLSIHIDDTKAHLLTNGMKLRSRSMLWLHKLSKFKNLETLGVEYCCIDWSEFHMDGESQTEEELWQFLAPRVLKKEDDDHSPCALQKRRIWGGSRTLSSCHVYTLMRNYRMLAMKTDQERAGLRTS